MYYHHAPSLFHILKHTATSEMAYRHGCASARLGSLGLGSVSLSIG